MEALGAILFFAYGEEGPITVISDKLPAAKGDFYLNFQNL